MVALMARTAHGSTLFVAEFDTQELCEKHFAYLTVADPEWVREWEDIWYENTEERYW